MRIRIVLSRGQEYVREQVLESAAAIVGRDPLCDVVIGDRAISRQHMRIELSGEGVLVEDLGSRNGIRVNGVAAQRVRVHHLDIIEIGDHQIHLFVEAQLPDGTLDFEDPFQDAAIPGEDPDAIGLDETQPGTGRMSDGAVYALKRIDEVPTDAAPLVAARTVLGEPGRAALIVQRRDKLLVTKLSRAALSVNGAEVVGASCAVGVGDVIDVGAVRYELVRVD
jgi:hypothetical protein